MKKCKICMREYPDWAHTDSHPDLCVECGNRATKFMKAAYILAKGKPDALVNPLEVQKLMLQKSDNEIDELCKEIKRVKYNEP
jgi:hypothetical protein